MPKPDAKKSKEARSLRSAIASAKDASDGSPSPTHSQSASSDHDGDDMTLIWEKLTDKILSQMNARFDKLEQSLQTVQSCQKELLEKVELIDTQVLEQDNRISCLEKEFSNLNKENTALKLKVDDLEGQARRNNIKIIGIPERAEGGKPAEFVQALLPRLLGEAHFKSAVIIDRAYRLGPIRPGGARPRAILARIHFYREKELVLQLRRQRQLEYEGNKVLIFPDYTPEVMRQRREFNEVLAELRERKVEHNLLFPARLRVKYQDQVKFFTEPGEAISFVNKT